MATTYNNAADHKPIQYNIQTGGASGTLNNVAPSATSGIAVISQGSSSQPIFGTVTVAGGGTGAVTLTGVLIGNGTSAVTGNAVTQYDVLVGGSSNAISSVGPGTSGQVLQSGGNAANPAYSTATYPATTTINQLLYSSASNTISGITAVNYGVLISSSSGVPSWLANGTTGQILTATTSGTPSWAAPATSGTVTSISAGTGITLTPSPITSTGSIALTVPVAVSSGGTGATSLTGVLIGNGTSAVTGNAVTQYDVLVGGASNAISSVGPGTQYQVLQSGGGSANPAYSTATYPATTTINQLLYSSAANTIGGVTAGDYGVLISSSSGVPSWLANGTTGQVLTATTSGNPSWAVPAASSVSITGDSGTMTGASFTIYANNSGNNCGSSVKMTVSGTTETLNVTDSNQNTLIGQFAGNSSVSGAANVGLGQYAGTAITSGANNTIIGSQAGDHLKAGSYNTLIGYIAGNSYTTSESSNIQIGNSVTGTLGESNVLRIGNGTGTSSGQLNAAYICGITGITVTGTAVLVSASNQLGIAVSSERYKENIEPLTKSRVLELEPKSFNYKVGSDQSAQTGLIAEEVFEIMPQLVVLDKEGLPQSVKYHDLPVLLLLEIQKLKARIEILEKK